MEFPPLPKALAKKWDKKTALIKRHEIFTCTREFFSGHGFIEIHTPLLVTNPGLEPYLHHFEVAFTDAQGRATGKKAYLPTSPEYHLKKALALGFDKVFEITRSYRNGELGPRHEPEFFMLEWYRHPGVYAEIADDFFRLMATLGARFGLADDKNFWAQREDITVREAFKKYADLDLDAALKGISPLKAQARGRFSIQDTDSEEDAFFKVVVEAIEPKLGFNGPCFLWDYPADQCAMARVKAETPRYCERFEVYWRGIELANAFGELTDPAEQRKRCLEDIEKRKKLYGHSPELDEDFFVALAKLDQTAAGIAVGFERLIQCLLGAETLQEVIAFPVFKEG